MGKLWDLYEEYKARQVFPPSQRKVAAKLLMSPTAFGNWRAGLTDLPAAVNLVRFSELIRVPYQTVLDAALHDAGYLPKPEVSTDDAGTVLSPGERARIVAEAQQAALAEAARRTPTGKPTPAQRRRAALDAVGEESQDPGGM